MCLINFSSPAAALDMKQEAIEPPIPCAFHINTYDEFISKNKVEQEAMLKAISDLESAFCQKDHLIDHQKIITLFSDLIKHPSLSTSDMIKTFFNSHPGFLTGYDNQLLTALIDSPWPDVSWAIKVNRQECIPYTNLFLKTYYKEPIDEAEVLHQMAQLNLEQQQRIHELAFDKRNPWVFRPSEESIPPQNYAIHFLWINAKPDIESVSLIANNSLIARQKEHLHEKLIIPISQWMKLHPETPICLWYDSAMTTEAAVANTLQEFEEYFKTIKMDSVPTLSLRDIRIIPTTQENRDVFNESIPLFFRVDLLKALISIHSLTTDKFNFCTFSDIDVNPVSRIKMFDNSNIEGLNKWGIVMAATTGCSMQSTHENSYMVFKNKPESIKAQQNSVIDKSIARIKSGKPIGEQDVFLKYSNLFSQLRSYLEENKIPHTGLPHSQVVVAPNSRFLGG